MSGQTGVPRERPLWLEIEPDPVFVFLHEPDPAELRSTAVIICPPFGWQEMCSHRARRAWAQTLARAGFPTARIDFQGAGESGGTPAAPGRVAAWITAVAETARWLRERTGATRVAAVGIGLGGIISYAAAAEGAPLDDLILWGVPARPRTMLRELRAYAGIVATRYPDDSREPPADGALEITGSLLTAETSNDLEQLELTSLPLPDANHRRALLIGRDKLGVDRRLRERLESVGAAVTVLEASDYDDLMAHPQEARTPEATIEASVAWLKEGDGSVRAGAGHEVSRPSESRPPIVARDSATLVGGDRAIKETALMVRTELGRSVGVITRPADGRSEPVCAVLLNAGALRRIGPNRMWVELSRRWAARGVPTVRIDFSGIGDSDGQDPPLVANASLYSPAMTEQVVTLLDELAAQGLPERFVLVGLCSGAYWALHAALADPRVSGAFLLNLYSFYWSEALVAERDRRETVAALRGGMLRRVARGRVSAEQVGRAVRSLRSSLRRDVPRSVEAGQTSEVVLALDRLRDQGTTTLIALSHGEPLYDQFEREGRLAQLDLWPNVSLERIPSRDHMARALWLQEHVHARLDAALEHVLEGTPTQARSGVC